MMETVQEIRCYLATRILRLFDEYRPWDSTLVINENISLLRLIDEDFSRTETRAEEMSVLEKLIGKERCAMIQK
jgi:hypothetical protein